TTSGGAAARASSWRIACRPSATLTRSSCSTRAGSSSAAPTRSSSPRKVSMPPSSPTSSLSARFGGDLVSVGANHPLLLGSGDVWIVAEGAVDVFAVPVAGGEVAGHRHHVLRAVAGAGWFG